MIATSARSCRDGSISSFCSCGAHTHSGQVSAVRSTPAIPVRTKGPVQVPTSDAAVVQALKDVIPGSDSMLRSIDLRRTLYGTP